MSGQARIQLIPLWLGWLVGLCPCMPLGLLCVPSQADPGVAQPEEGWDPMLSRPNSL